MQNAGHGQERLEEDIAGKYEDISICELLD